MTLQNEDLQQKMQRKKQKTQKIKAQMEELSQSLVRSQKNEYLKDKIVQDLERERMLLNDQVRRLRDQLREQD